MGKGKTAAQCCHACLGAYKRALKMRPAHVQAWNHQGQAKVVLRVETVEELFVVSFFLFPFPSFVFHDDCAHARTGRRWQRRQSGCTSRTTSWSTQDARRSRLAARRCSPSAPATSARSTRSPAASSSSAEAHHCSFSPTEFAETRNSSVLCCAVLCCAVEGQNGKMGKEKKKREEEGEDVMKEGGDNDETQRGH